MLASRLRRLPGDPYSPDLPFLGTAPMLAPLCGISDSAFRRVCREFGAGVVFTEMVSAEGIVAAAGAAWRMLKFHPDEAPIWVQLSSSNPEIMGRAAAAVSDLGFSAINLNMGCPAKKVVKGDRGAALMKDLPLAQKVAEAACRATPLPVTVKMRLGWTHQQINYLELGQRLQDAGAAAVILHGRTREQEYRGVADWEAIGLLKQRLQIPVVGNGDVVDPDSAARMLRETGCDQIMIGRGAFGAPWIFRDIAEARSGGAITGQPAPEAVLQAIERHLSYALEDGDEGLIVNRMRGHILRYSKGFRGSAAFRKAIVRVDGAEAQRAACREFFLGNEAGE